MNPLAYGASRDVTVTFHPKRMLITAAILGMLGVTLSLAIDLERGAAAAGLLAVLAYVFIEVLGFVYPAAWWQQSRNGRS